MLFHRDLRKPFWRGFLHAIVLTLYIFFVAIISYSMPHLFGTDIDIVIRWAFYLFITVLTLAAAGYLVFYEPMKHVLRSQFKRGTVMLTSTIGWLFVFLVVFLLGFVWTLVL